MRFICIETERKCRELVSQNIRCIHSFHYREANLALPMSKKWGHNKRVAITSNLSLQALTHSRQNYAATNSKPNISPAIGAIEQWLLTSIKSKPTILVVPSTNARSEAMKDFVLRNRAVLSFQLISMQKNILQSRPKVLEILNKCKGWGQINALRCRVMTWLPECAVSISVVLSKVASNPSWYWNSAIIVLIIRINARWCFL